MFRENHKILGPDAWGWGPWGSGPLGLGSTEPQGALLVLVARDRSEDRCSGGLRADPPGTAEVLPIYPIDLIVYTRTVNGLNRSGERGPAVVIIGGGASGALAAIALLNLSGSQRCPVRIVMIDRYGRHGLGQAYSTTHPDHLLNAPADQMSAVAGDPKHLIRWAEAAGEDTTGFLPRRVYGRYLRQALDEAARDAAPLASLTLLTGDVVSVGPGAVGPGAVGPGAVGPGAAAPGSVGPGPGPREPALRLVTSDGDELGADVAVLATGSLPPALPFPTPQSRRIVVDPWAPGALDEVADGSEVLVLGTGLTAIDLALTVTSGHPGAVVHLVSRHGLLPRPHREAHDDRRPVRLPEIEALAAARPAAPQTAAELRLSDLMALVSAALAANPGSWPEVMDALRPCVPAFWQAMPVGDQRVFLSRLSRFWEVHRHRVPQATGRRIAELRRSGRLVLRQGRITSVTEHGSGLRVELATAGADGAAGAAEAGSAAGTGGQASRLDVGWLLNGTGQGTDVARAADPLWRELLDAGLARPDPHGLGLAASANGALLDRSGQPSSVLFTLGPVLRGQWYETTAVPEIRAQAAALAKVIAERADRLSSKQTDIIGNTSAGN
jgi:uncharacterized NAD(P)/FAD-binding protein YdhS